MSKETAIQWCDSTVNPVMGWRREFPHDGHSILPGAVCFAMLNVVPQALHWSIMITSYPLRGFVVWRPRLRGFSFRRPALTSLWRCGRRIVHRRRWRFSAIGRHVPQHGVCAPMATEHVERKIEHDALGRVITEERQVGDHAAVVAIDLHDERDVDNDAGAPEVLPISHLIHPHPPAFAVFTNKDDQMGAVTGPKVEFGDSVFLNVLSHGDLAFDSVLHLDRRHRSY